MKLRFVRKLHEVDDVWSFFFDPAEKLHWQAGQSIRLEIPKKSWGVIERRFTISSAPYEGQIRITTKVSHSDFKQALSKLTEGDEITGTAIEGSFVWGKEKKHRLFVAAGIGITPYRALLSERINDKNRCRATLLYRSRLKPAIFEAELHTWQQKDKSLNVMYLTDHRLQLIKKSTLAPFWLDSLVYISGPEVMVRHLTQQFIEKGLPKEQLKTDQFTGYEHI
jgi:ferredoxin-NADP reductase